MFINNLKKMGDTELAKASVASKARKLRKQIEENKNPSSLMRQARNIYDVSQQHPLAKPLAKLATEATELALTLDRKYEQIAKQVVKNGEQVNGKSGRFTQMVQRRGYAQSLVRNVEMEIGAKNFHKLVDLGAIQYTAEFFVAKYMPFAVSAEILNSIHCLLASVETNVAYSEAA